MAVTNEATTVWQGDLKSGSGTVALDSSKAGQFPLDWAGRSEGVPGQTNPEELIAAAHSACFSMALSNALAEAGHAPERLQVTAAVTFQATAEFLGITGSHLLLNAQVPGIDEAEFLRIAEDAKQNCPVSRALAGITITLEASLA